jgi:hypothetical protein
MSPGGTTVVLAVLQRRQGSVLKHLTIAIVPTGLVCLVDFPSAEALGWPHSQR